jgi:hypothetical protein
MLRIIIHNREDALDKISGHFLVKKITHRIHKDYFRGLPFIRKQQLVGMNSDFKSIFVLLDTHSLQPFGHNLGIAILAAVRVLRASSSWIPRQLSPFNA